MAVIGISGSYGGLDHHGIVVGGEVPWGCRRRLARDVRFAPAHRPIRPKGPMGREEGGIAAS